MPRRKNNRSIGAKNKRKQNTGGAVRVPAQPPPVRFEHWRPITLAWTATVVDAKSLFVTIGDVKKKLDAQLGVTSNYEFRLRTIRLWETKGVSCTLECYAQVDLVEVAYAPHVVYQAESFPSKMSYARLGYAWPRTENSLPTNGTEGNTLFKVNGNGAAEFVLHLHLDFMFSAAKPFVTTTPLGC